MEDSNADTCISTYNVSRFMYIYTRGHIRTLYTIPIGFKFGHDPFPFTHELRRNPYIG